MNERLAHMPTQCPCCKDGNGFLFIVDEAFPDEPPQRFKCCHCDGTGKVLRAPDDGEDQLQSLRQ
jgi:hypothetical protein